MKVCELIAALEQMPKEAEVRLAVGWAKDTAISDRGENIAVETATTGVMVRGWLSNCDTTLEINYEDEDPSEG